MRSDTLCGSSAKGMIDLATGRAACRFRHLCFHADVDVGMDMRGPAEMPDDGRPFHAPDVPFLVVEQVFLLVEGHVQLVDAAASLQDLEDLVDVFLAVRCKNHLEGLF